MSHSDHAKILPAGFKITATSDSMVSVIENKAKGFYGLQFHPEVSHTQRGSDILKNFLNICGYKFEWTTGHFIKNEVARIKQTVGPSKVICALSGG